jgi:hypothetical protein
MVNCMQGRMVHFILETNNALLLRAILNEISQIMDRFIFPEMIDMTKFFNNIL